MALVDTKNNFSKKDSSIETPVSKPAAYLTDENYFQITTYSSEENKSTSHSNQVIVFKKEGLLDLIKIWEIEFPDLFANNIEIRNVPLINKKGELQYGLNWGQREHREPNQAYIQLTPQIYNSDFLPPNPQHFEMITDDGKRIIFTRASKVEGGAQLQTPENNSIFGKYLRDRLGVPYGKEITKNDLYNYGRTDISIIKMGDRFFFDFSNGKISNKISRKIEKIDSLVPFNRKNSKLEDISTNYFNSLLSKPFTILAGNSGTGKTKIAKDLATWLGKKDENTNTIANKLIVPVGSDWTDNTKILGFYNPLKKTYESTKILDFILLARENPEIPFFLIFDEMNLSHVERYFSDFLSAMESHEKIILYSKDEDCDSDIPESIDLPENLLVTGTVNIDETTYMFSPKVLDRANVIEFIPAQSDVLANFAAETQPIEIEPVNDGSAEGFLALAKTVRETTTLPEGSDICKTILKDISNILDGSGFEFAFRTAKEIRLYINAAYALAQNEGKTLSKEDYVNLMDEQLLQKILPKVHGNRSQVGTLLSNLSKYSEEQNLKESKKKIDRMLKQLETSQFTSFI